MAPLISVVLLPLKILLKIVWRTNQKNTLVTGISQPIF